MDALPGAEVGKVERSDYVGPHRLRAMALAPVHVRPSRLHQNVIYVVQNGGVWNRTRGRGGVSDLYWSGLGVLAIKTPHPFETGHRGFTPAWGRGLDRTKRIEGHFPCKIIGKIYGASGEGGGK